MSRDKEIKEFLDLTIEEIFADRFSRYSKYIIQDRALPDVRDGLKPVQRRILYSMHKEGNLFDKQFRKSAKTVGNVIGNYHPHGDTSVYDAMVRMSQSWKVNKQLIEMHGNNGSIDGDSAAAMRYTEAKMSKYSELMLLDINEDTVDHIPNFDDTELEPTILPSRLPNLLINGASGISAGYATDIPPHNATEIIKACIYLNSNPDSNLSDLMKIVKGPDFPTGAIVQGAQGIKDAFKTGKGKVVIKAKTEIKGNLIIIKEIPYDVNKSTLLQKIDIIRIDKKIDGIKEVLDQSDQKGLEIHVECKNDANAEVILNYLFKNTDLQKNYHYNMIAINKRRPEQLGILQILKSFILHREDVIFRRSEFRLEKANTRLHILHGLIKSIDILDEIIDTIKSSKDRIQSIDNISKLFGFTKIQAEAIVNMRLYRLSNTDITTLESNVSQLEIQVKELEEIIASKDKLKSVIDFELNEVLESTKVKRKTSIESEIQEIKINTEDLIKSEKVVVSITEAGYIKKATLRSYVASKELSSNRANDRVLKTVATNNRDKVAIFFNDGSYVLSLVNDITETKWKDNAKHVSTFNKLKDGVRVINLVCFKTFQDIIEIVGVSTSGYVSRITFSELNKNKFNQRIMFMKAKTNEEIVSCDVLENNMANVIERDFSVFTSQGRNLVLKSSTFEQNTLNRIGKRLGRLRKDEDIIGIVYCSYKVLVILNDSSYLLIDNSNCTKSTFVQICDKKRFADLLYVKKVQSAQLVASFDQGEEIVDISSLKVKERFSKLIKQELNSVEEFIEVNKE